MVEKKLKARDEARKSKDYKLADKIRKELYGDGIIIEDTDTGTKWRAR